MKTDSNTNVKEGKLLLVFTHRFRTVINFHTTLKATPFDLFAITISLEAVGGTVKVDGEQVHYKCNMHLDSDDKRGTNLSFDHPDQLHEFNLAYDLMKVTLGKLN